MTEKQLAKLFIKNNFSCYNMDCEICKETNFLHVCLQNDVKVYCKEILGRKYKDSRIDFLKSENRKLKKENNRLKSQIKVLSRGKKAAMMEFDGVDVLKK